MKRLLLVLAILAVGFTMTAEAKTKWHRVGEFSVSKDAKVVSLNREITKIMVSAKAGAPIIQVIWVIQGSQKKQITVARQFKPGEEAIFALEGGRQNVSELRIGDGGNGNYHILTD